MTDYEFDQVCKQFGERPDQALQAYGRVHDLATDREVAYDPYAITHDAQATCLGYMTDPPEDADGFSKLLCVCKSRQSGVSTAVENLAYVQSQYNPGWEHICSADTKDRADYLFGRALYLHNRWPEDLRIPLISSGQVRQFEWENNSKMLVRTGGGAGLGIGSAASSHHWSEVPLWPEASKQWSYLWPALANRRRVRFVMESTPFPMSEPSTDFFMEQCEAARAGNGRMLYAFFPYWDGKLNVRTWPQGQQMTNEEIRLMEMYARHGLRKEHLQFRRVTMDADREIRKNPDLFRVFYPFDDITCWMQTGYGVIKDRHLDRHLQGLHDFDWDRGWSIYDNPRKESKYALVADPSGYGYNDHAAFHVFEIWAGEWVQVASYASHADPPEFAKEINRWGRKYNNALVGVERNGVGLATVALLEEMEYPNMFYDHNGKPGIHKRSEDQFLSGLIDALMGELVLRDRDTVMQLKSYRADKMLQRTAKAQLLDVGKSGTRRDRHHWDKVSALMLLPTVAQSMPQINRTYHRREFVPAAPSSEFTTADWARLDKRIKEFRAKRSQRVTGRMGKYTRRGRRK